MKRVLNLPKITTSYSWKCQPKLPIKSKTLSRKMPNFLWTKFKKVPSILKTTLPESRLATQYKKLTKKCLPPKQLNPKKKRKDAADFIKTINY